MNAQAIPVRTAPPVLTELTDTRARAQVVGPELFVTKVSTLDVRS